MYLNACIDLQKNVNSLAALRVLLSGLGELDPKLRDDLIAESLSSFICSKHNNAKINKLIFSDLIGPQQIGIKGEEIEHVLKRSFSALILSAVIMTDNESFNSFSKKDLSDAFDAIEQFLINETNVDDQNDDYGWIHCFAHGGDVLTTIMVHKNCDKELAEKIIEFIQNVRKKDELNGISINSMMRLEESIKLGKVLKKIS